MQAAYGIKQMARAASAGAQKYATAHHVLNMQVRFMTSYPAHTKIVMPSLSPTMKAGTIAKWLKKEGDELKPGDGIAEVETDKATMTFENQDDGFLAKILKGDGSSEVAVGELIGIMVDSQADVAAFKDFKADTAKPTSTPAPSTPATPAPSAPSAPSAPAPKVEAPAPAKSAAPAAPKPAAPAPAPQAAQPAAAGDDAPYLAFAAWGNHLPRTPVGAALAKQQAAYVAAFGFTGCDPIAPPVAEKPAK